MLGLEAPVTGSGASPASRLVTRPDEGLPAAIASPLFGPLAPARRGGTGLGLALARRIGAPLLATNDSHYVHRDDAVAHDALLCVQTGSLMSDPDRFKFHGDEHYLKTAAEMRANVLRQYPGLGMEFTLNDRVAAYFPAPPAGESK